MSELTPPEDPCRPQQVQADDGAQVRFCAYGGHVLGWTPAGGAERLWLSRDTRCGDGAAVRGGIPVIWPQFSERGDGPRHGIARDRPWRVLSAGTGADGAAEVAMELVSDRVTRTLFPHLFRLSLDVRASGDGLEVTLGVRNDGVDDLVFAAALHTYLRVGSTASASIVGLTGRTAVRNDDGGAYRLDEQAVAVDGPLDVEVPGAGDVELRLVDPDLGDLRLGAEGFASRVVWNPGVGHAPGDVHDGGELEFVCVEPAQTDRVTLAPGERWQGRQTLRTA